MSGHSKWSTIKRKKAKEDARRGKIFTKLAREIEIAARDGGDPEINFGLRLAIDRAKEANMPNENIERAIRRGTGEDRDAAKMEKIPYEGYAPHGIALIINTITDNRNRTVSDIRHILTKHGGNMGQEGSVAWQFTKKSYFNIPKEACDYEDLFEIAVETGVDDVVDEEEYFEIIGPVEVFKHTHDALKAAEIPIEDSGLRMEPNQEIDLALDETLQVMQVIDSLEDLDDVQRVYTNLKISEDALEKVG